MDHHILVAESLVSNAQGFASDFPALSFIIFRKRNVSEDSLVVFYLHFEVSLFRMGELQSGDIGRSRFGNYRKGKRMPSVNVYKLRHFE